MRCRKYVSEKKDIMEGLGRAGAKEHTGLWGKSTRQKVFILLSKENRTDDTMHRSCHFSTTKVSDNNREA